MVLMRCACVCPQRSQQQPAQWHHIIEPGSSDRVVATVRAPKVVVCIAWCLGAAFVCARSYLYGNQLSGSIPLSLSSLTALNILCVRRSSHVHGCVRSAEAPCRVWMCARSQLSNSGLCGTVPTVVQPNDGALPACASNTTRVFSCTQQDATCSALGDLFDATNGAGWTIKIGWASASAGTSTDYCTFSGVACNGGGLVTQLCVALHCMPQRYAD
jgi:hypothetical protein